MSTSTSQEPLIRLEPGGKAPIISYNVPEPTMYSGRTLIFLELDTEYFAESLREAPKESLSKSMKGKDLDEIKGSLLTSMKTKVGGREGVRFSEKSNPKVAIESDSPMTERMASLDLDTVAERAQAGEKLVLYRNLWGDYDYRFIREPLIARPRLVLVETYHISSFLGNYGAGRTIKTFSLLPGEKTTISVKTYRKTEESSKMASSILDSFTEESAEEFQSSIEKEQTSKETYDESYDYHADVGGGVNLGIVNFDAGGDWTGGTNAGREETSKNVSSAVEKHAQTASAKREVNVDTSYEVKEEEEEETLIERTIENINVSRTLNFVFRQMNQEFITLVHLVDVRVGFWNGFSEAKREATLPELDSLLEEVIVNTKRKDVKEVVLNELKNIFDYKGNVVSFVDEVHLKNSSGTATSSYWRVKKDYVSTYKDVATGTEVTVAGPILSVKKNILRTDGVIVEAILGQGGALDAYSQSLQNETIIAKSLTNELTRRQIKREELAQKIVESKDELQAKLFEQIFEESEEEEEETEEE